MTVKIWKAKSSSVRFTVDGGNALAVGYMDFTLAKGARDHVRWLTDFVCPFVIGEDVEVFSLEVECRRLRVFFREEALPATIDDEYVRHFQEFIFYTLKVFFRGYLSDGGPLSDYFSGAFIK